MLILISIGGIQHILFFINLHIKLDYGNKPWLSASSYNSFLNFCILSFFIIESSTDVPFPPIDTF